MFRASHDLISHRVAHLITWFCFFAFSGNWILTIWIRLVTHTCCFPLNTFTERMMENKGTRHLVFFKICHFFHVFSTYLSMYLIYRRYMAWCWPTILSAFRWNKQNGSQVLINTKSTVLGEKLGWLNFISFNSNRKYVLSFFFLFQYVNHNVKCLGHLMI